MSAKPLKWRDDRICETKSSLIFVAPFFTTIEASGRNRESIPDISAIAARTSEVSTLILAIATTLRLLLNRTTWQPNLTNTTSQKIPDLQNTFTQSWTPPSGYPPTTPAAECPETV